MLWVLPLRKAKEETRWNGSTTTSKKPEAQGNLIKGNLKPGDCVFSDQLVSHVRGRRFHTAGKKADKDKFCGSTLFYDGASGYIDIQHQVTFNATDTILSKEAFERRMDRLGTPVKTYHTDNGIYTSRQEERRISQEVTQRGVKCH